MCEQPTISNNIFMMLFIQSNTIRHFPKDKNKFPYRKMSKFQSIILSTFSYYLFQLNLTQLPFRSMNEKRNKPRYNAEFKTFNSEQSCIDVFSRVESLFLEKFFRYNLSDYFHQTLMNVEQDLLQKKIKNKQLKQLASETFLAKKNMRISEFKEKVNNFYDMEQSQFGRNFEYLYSNVSTGEDTEVQEKQLIMVQVKMRAEIEKIQNLPLYFYKQIELCQKEHSHFEEKQEDHLVKHLRNYQKKSLSLFIVYFGDINFHIFNMQHYSPKTIKFFYNQLNVKIHVFFVSRLALIDKFKRINKIQHLEYVNDLLIQLYEFKREKLRNKRSKARKINSQVLPLDKKTFFHKFQAMTLLKWVSIFSFAGLTLGAIFFKFFF